MVVLTEPDREKVGERKSVCVWERERERNRIGARERESNLPEATGDLSIYDINGQSQIVSALIENYLRLP